MPQDVARQRRWGSKGSKIRLLNHGLPPLLAEDAPVLVDGASSANSRRDRRYLCFDVGMTQTLNVAGYKVRVREEVANVFDQFNVVGYTYLPTPAGTPVELRNALGRRIYNLSLGVDLARTGDND